jgi:hypothetical protein
MVIRVFRVLRATRVIRVIKDSRIGRGYGLRGV